MLKLAQNRKLIRLIGAFCFLTASLSVSAQSAAPTAKPEVESTLTAKRVEIDVDKKEKLIDAKTVKPGEVIEYHVTYTNKGKTPVANLLATLPIPENTDFQRNTANPAGAKASTRNGGFQAMPLKKKVKLPSGKEEEIEIPLSEYRALQWSLGELAAGKSVVVVARVRVSDAPTPAPAPATPPTPAGAPAAKGGQK